jgi:hypothetical protein
MMASRSCLPFRLVLVLLALVVPYGSHSLAQGGCTESDLKLALVGQKVITQVVIYKKVSGLGDVPKVGIHARYRISGVRPAGDVLQIFLESKFGDAQNLTAHFAPSSCDPDAIREELASVFQFESFPGVRHKSLPSSGSVAIVSAPSGNPTTPADTRPDRLPLQVIKELEEADRSSLIGLGRLIARESRLLKEYRGPASTYLRNLLALDVPALKRKIDALPPVHVSEQDVALPAEYTATTIRNALEKYSLLESRLKFVNAQIGLSAESPQLVNGPDFPLVADQIGNASTATLKQRSEEVLAAQVVSARLNGELTAVLPQKAAADERAAKEAERRAALDRRKPVFALYGADLRVIHGRRFSITRSKAIELMDHVIDQIRDGVVPYIDERSFFATIDGGDRSTTAQALAKLRATAIGRYYVLQGDVFQIQADRDYPASGRTNFTMFGRRMLASDYWVSLNVECISTEPVPPYSIAPVLVQFIDFRRSVSTSGRTIIVPIARVIDVFEIPPLSDVPAEVIINQDHLP